MPAKKNLSAWESANHSQNHAAGDRDPVEPMQHVMWGGRRPALEASRIGVAVSLQFVDDRPPKRPSPLAPRDKLIPPEPRMLAVSPRRSPMPS